MVPTGASCRARVALAPNAMNTSENPRTNASDVIEHLPPRARRVSAGRLLHVLERDAGDERDVARHERQDAGRDEREDARDKRREVGDVRQESLHFLERNHVRARHRAEVLAELDRRQVLEHEVPLPALRRVRRLQPVARRHGPRERRPSRARRNPARPRAAWRSRRAASARGRVSSPATRTPRRASSGSASLRPHRPAAGSRATAACTWPVMFV